MKNLIKKEMKSYLSIFEKTIRTHGYEIEDIAIGISHCIRNGNKVLICGNGGSAADAQHMAAELISRFEKNRHPYPAISLSTDTSVITSIGNDFGFDHIFSKQIKALGRQGDILIAISTSGSSKNIINAITEARKNKMTTIILTGSNGSKISNVCDYSIIVDSKRTCRIQEVHTFVYHTICQLVENLLTGDK